MLHLPDLRIHEVLEGEGDEDKNNPFQNLKMRQSIRLPDYDYTLAGAYFITICTDERKSILGEISDESVLLNPHGLIVKECWEGIPLHFPKVELSMYVVMPNHLHGIIILHDSVAARHAVPSPLLTERMVSSEAFGKPVAGSLPTIIRSFKSAVSKQVNSLRNTQSPFWQRGYYEHVIRSEQEFSQIAEYITYNPMKWTTDRENPCAVTEAEALPFEH